MINRHERIGRLPNDKLSAGNALAKLFERLRARRCRAGSANKVGAFFCCPEAGISPASAEI
jgi:hypothetical protein